MKYELEPDNRNCPDEELMADLQAVANRLEALSLTKEMYDANGRFSSSTIQKRFGSWNNALAQCGIAVQKRVDIPEEELLADLQRVAKKLQNQTVSREQYRTHGQFADITLSRHFGNWAASLTKAGLKSTGWKPPATEEDLFENMAQVWEHVGRQPTQKDFRPPVSRYSKTTYVNYYGSWRAALEAFVNAANSQVSELPKKQKKTQSASKIDNISKSQRRTGRTPSWRERFLVMRRDNFACRLCGASPAKNPSVSLHIDHIKPWSEGGETILPNLQTCCEKCNIGKSNLSMEEEK
jgi:5-methylcytosine-specific restriction endonuclease McrA